jgi:hypothetical protein
MHINFEIFKSAFLLGPDHILPLQCTPTTKVDPKMKVDKKNLASK